MRSVILSHPTWHLVMKKDYGPAGCYLTGVLAVWLGKMHPYGRIGDPPDGRENAQ